MMNTKNIGIAVLVVVVLGVGGWYAYSHKALMSNGTGATAGSTETVATVNGEKITRAQLTSTESQITAQEGVEATTTDAQAQLQTQALDSLIAQALLKQAAQTAGITASSTAVDAQVEATKGQFSTPAEYQQALVAQGMTEDDLRAQISDSLIINTYLDQTLHVSAVTASEAEIQAAYTQIAAGQTGVPPLAQVHDQVEQSVIQQKQQTLIDAQVQKLRTAGNVQVLI